MKPQKRYTTEPREAYALLLRQIRNNMVTLQGIVEEAVDEGVPENVEWADVGEAKKLYWTLQEAVQIGL